MRLSFQANIRTLLLAACLISGVGLAVAPPASAQVVIYRLEFEQDGESINYGFYDGGYVVADAIGGPASWIFTFREGAQRFYITVPEFGSLFYAGNPSEIKGVVSAAAADGTPQTTFLAIGQLTQTVDADNIRVEIPGEMRGYALSANDETELPFTVEEGIKGYAGTSIMRCYFQNPRSSNANDDGLTVAETITRLTEELERRGTALFEADDGEDGDGEEGEDGENGDGENGGDNPVQLPENGDANNGN